MRACVVVGAEYSLETGVVEFLDEAPAAGATEADLAGRAEAAKIRPAYIPPRCSRSSS